MKKLIAAGLALVLILSMAGCASPHAGEAVFRTENVRTVTFFTPNARDGLVVPQEDLDEIIQWLGTFTVGEKAGETLKPGSNQVSVRIEYTDGSFFENGLSTVKIEDKAYYMDYGNAPECYLRLLEAQSGSFEPQFEFSQEIEDAALKEPPDLTLSVNGQEGINTYKGAYHWTIKHDDGTFTDALADSAHVLQAQKFMTPIVRDSEKDLIHKAELNSELVPDKIIVHRWSAEHWNKPSVNGEIIEVECVEPEPVPGYTGSMTPTYTLVLQEGEYIYEVYAEWNSYENYEGNAYFGFYTSAG